MKNRFGRELGRETKARASGECFTYRALKFTCWPLTQSGAGKTGSRPARWLLNTEVKKGMRKLRAHTAPFVCRCLEAPAFCLNRLLLAGSLSFETPAAFASRRNGNFAPFCAFFFVERNIAAFSSQLVSVVSACTHSVFEGRPHGSRFEVCVCALHSPASLPPPGCRQQRSAPIGSNFPGAVGMLSRRPGPLISPLLIWDSSASPKQTAPG